MSELLQHTKKCKYLISRSATKRERWRWVSGMNDYAFIPPYCFSKDCKTSKDVLWGLFYNRNLTSLEGSGDLNGGVVSDKVQ